MAPILGDSYEGNVLIPGRFNNYNIAGNITGAFAVGEIGSSDDFFLVGVEPREESIYPSLTGNILDSEGNLLFQLRNNIIKLNPGNCSKIFGDSLGYEIHDSAGQLIFKVDTVFAHLPQLNEETFVTTIKANFYNKAGVLVFKANSGEPDEKILVSTKNVFGYSNGSMGIVSGMKREEVDFLRFIFSTGNAAVEPIIGLTENEEFDLNGKVLIDATIRGCTVSISGGDFEFIGKVSMIDNRYIPVGSAKKVIELFNQIVSSEATPAD